MTRMWIAMALGLAVAVTAVSAARGEQPAAPQHSELSDQERAEALEFLMNGVPERRNELEALRREQPHQLDLMLRDALREKEHLAMLKREDPEAFRLAVQERSMDAKMSELGFQYRQAADEGERLRVKKQLEELVGNLFDLREQRRAQEIQHLQAELARLTELQKKRKENRSAIVQRRVDELCGLEEQYAW
ncbi:MAG: hypothetical protein HYV63_24670 [Candidatus Schekmanbacteria bacterium]|nr:hypothetical protein [Candidatus Schekmanbacteria bacterium]